MQLPAQVCILPTRMDSVFAVASKCLQNLKEESAMKSKSPTRFACQVKTGGLTMIIQAHFKQRLEEIRQLREYKIHESRVTPVFVNPRNLTQAGSRTHASIGEGGTVREANQTHAWRILCSRNTRNISLTSGLPSHGVITYTFNFAPFSRMHGQVCLEGLFRVSYSLNYRTTPSIKIAAF